MLLSPEVEIEHILPFSQTLDDSLNNKTVAMRQANRVKGNRTPWEAFGATSVPGFDYAGILERAKAMPRAKRYRFAQDGLAKFQGENDFLARALNDTRYMSKIAREYLSLICPQNTRAIPGRMTAMLRAKFGLNNVLGTDGLKNRNDHRHHAVDACVIAVTDQGLLQRFAKASASAREQQLERLVENMPLPWDSYRDHVHRAINNIWVSHKPDHGYEGEMFDATIYNAQGYSRSAAKNRTVIPFEARQGQVNAAIRHQGKKATQQPYKGLLSNSNYCMEIVRSENGTWEGEVISTFAAYQLVRKHGLARLRHPTLSASGKPLVMRLVINDYVGLKLENEQKTTRLQVLQINSKGSITFIKPNEANIGKRYDAKRAAQKKQKSGEIFSETDLSDEFFRRAFSATSLKEAHARRVTISPIGELKDPGFKE